MASVVCTVVSCADGGKCGVHYGVVCGQLWGFFHLHMCACCACACVCVCTVNIKKLKVTEETSPDREEENYEVIQSDLKDRFNKLAKDLLHAAVNVTKPDEKNRWNRRYKASYGAKLFELVETLGTTIEVQFAGAFPDEGWDVAKKKVEWDLWRHREAIQNTQKVPIPELRCFADALAF